jgi:hypothetical protein
MQSNIVAQGDEAQAAIASSSCAVHCALLTSSTHSGTHVGNVMQASSAAQLVTHASITLVGPSPGGASITTRLSAAASTRVVVESRHAASSSTATTIRAPMTLVNHETPLPLSPIARLGAGFEPRGLVEVLERCALDGARRST